MRVSKPADNNTNNNIYMCFAIISGSGMCDASQLPADRLVVSIMSVVVHLQMNNTHYGQGQLADDAVQQTGSLCSTCGCVFWSHLLQRECTAFCMLHKIKRVMGWGQTSMCDTLLDVC